MTPEEKLKAKSNLELVLNSRDDVLNFTYDYMAYDTRLQKDDDIIHTETFIKLSDALSICQEAVDEACKNAKIEECKYWQDAIFSPQSIIAQLSVIDFQLRITELSLPESPKERV